MKEVRYIHLAFENCEVVRIDRERIGLFGVNNIRRNASRMASNSISDHLTCDELYIQISSKANDLSCYLTTWFDSDVLPFSRINDSRDIVAIDIIYEDGTNEYVYVDWSGDSDYENPIQTSAINDKTGDLYLVVSAVNTAHKMFADHLTDYNSSFWDLYD